MAENRYLKDLLNKGIALVDAGRLVETMDFYANLLTNEFLDVIKTDKVDIWRARFLSMIAVGSVSSKMKPVASPALMYSLRRIEKDQTLPFDYRILASFNLGTIYKHLKHDYARAATRFRNVVNLAKMLDDDDSGLDDLDEMLSDALTMLSLIEDVPPSADTTDFDIVDYHIPTIDNSDECINIMNNLVERLHGTPRIYTNQGAQCNREKGSQTDNLENTLILKTCAKCLRYAYCSKECQKIHWKADHKKFCRSTEDFRKGDIVKVTMINVEMARERFGFDKLRKWDQEYAGFVLEIVGEGQEPGKWKVAPVRDDGSRGIEVEARFVTLKIPVGEM
ncbi:hypothetical protein HDU76_005572 [Blyttiomyces sp. JEL0837]|nr:hypothetical protein HDU76_005572 [Blyttiomyces sp. JEL0837]